MHELPGPHWQAIESLAADLERDDAGGLPHHALEPQAMAQGPRDREHDPERDDRCQRRRVQRPPVRAGGGLMLELVAGGELVAERQCHREVGIEVQVVPRLVAQPAAGGPC